MNKNNENKATVEQLSTEKGDMKKPNPNYKF
jgi:hypothetical protein